MFANAVDLDRRYMAEYERRDREKLQAVEDEIREHLARGVPIGVIEVLSIDRNGAERVYSVYVDRGILAYVALAARVRRHARMNEAYRFFLKYVTKVRPV